MHTETSTFTLSIVAVVGKLKSVPNPSPEKITFTTIFTFEHLLLRRLPSDLTLKMPHSTSRPDVAGPVRVAIGTPTLTIKSIIDRLTPKRQGRYFH
jgi:hypothetical protein